MEWRQLLINRFTISFFLVGLVVCAVWVYMFSHDDGILEGRVMTQDGSPVNGAEVILLKPGVVGFDHVDKVITDGEGRFRFEKHNQHHPVLKAGKEDTGESGLIDIRLYFRNQNYRHPKPILLNPKK